VCLSKSQKAWLAMAAVVVCLALVASMALRPSSFLTAAGDLTQCVLLSSLLVAVVANMRVGDRLARFFWFFMSIGIGVWLSSQLLWTYFEVILRKEVPNPFIGDVAIVLHLVPIVAALAIRPDREEQRSQLRSLDFVLLFSWWLYLYLFFVIPWQYVVPDAPKYGRNFDVLYFAGHVVVLLVAVDAWRNAVGMWRAVYGRILLASFVYAAASIAASVAIDYGAYYTGSLYDIPLLFSVLLFTWMALLGNRVKAIEDPTSPQVQRGHPRVTALVILAASSLPILAAWSFFLSDAPGRIRHYRLGLTLSMIFFIGALRSIKQYTLDKELEHANEELHEASVTDALTGVRNRRFLTTTLDKDVQQALRFYSSDNTMNRNRDLIFYLIDIDHFKIVNDQFGHQQGDVLLVQVAARISSAIRYSDVLIRWGGEEFLVVSRFTDRDNAEILAKRVLDAVGSEEFQLTSGRIRRTCSVGWAVFPWSPERPDEVSCQEVLRFADQALYQAKHAGRNTAMGMLSTHAGHHSGERGSYFAEMPSKVPEARMVATKGP
jgi:diguanylate cyclase (GGDEF)-like protein